MSHGSIRVDRSDHAVRIGAPSSVWAPILWFRIDRTRSQVVTQWGVLIGVSPLVLLGLFYGGSLFDALQLALVVGLGALCLLIGVLVALLAAHVVWRSGLLAPSPQSVVRSASERDRLQQEVGQIAQIGGWEFDPISGEGNWTEEVAQIHDIDPAVASIRSIGLDAYRGIDRQRIEEAISAALKDGTPFDLELQIKTSTGVQKWVRSICKPEVQGQKVTRIKGTIQDISAQKQLEDDLKHVNLLYSTLSELSHKMSRVSAATELYQLACHIIVDVGKFSSSRISAFESSDGKLTQMIACAGSIEKYSTRIDSISSDNDQAVEMTRKVMRGEIQVVNSVHEDDRMHSLISVAEALQIGSAAAFPIRCHDRVIGVLSVYSEQVNRFRSKEISLFERITETIRHKLELIQEEQNRKMAEQASRESQARFEAVFVHSPVGILLTEVQSGTILAANPALVRILGIQVEELRGNTVEKLGLWESPIHRQLFIDRLQSSKSAVQLDGKLCRKGTEGQKIPVRLSSVQIDLSGQQLIVSTIEDQTQVEIAQEASAKNTKLQAQLQQIAQTVPGIICSFHMDKEGTLTIPYVSRDLFALYGVHYTGLGDDLSEMRSRFNVEDQKRVRKSIERSAATLTPWCEDYRMIHPVRGEIWIEGHAVPYREANGCVLWHGFLHDITERKRKEEQLRQSEQRFRALFQHSPVAYQSLSEDACYLDVNERMCELLGYSSEELIGSSFADLVVPSLRGLFWDGFQKFCLAGKGTTELRVMRSDGTEIELMIEGQIQRDGLGRFLRTHCIVFDVTERRYAEQGLRLQSAALQAAANAIVITDSRGVVEWCNPAFTECSGYSSGEAKGMRLGDLVRSGQQSRSFYKQMWETISSGRPWHGELVNRRKDGSTYHEQMSITPLVDERKQISHFITIKQDISNQKRLETMLLRTQRLESIGRLASGVAHDLNNVLTPMLMAPLMLRAVIDDPMALEVVDSIESSARRGAAIIKQLLTFGRGMPGERIPVQLCSIVREMTKLMEQTFPKNIEVQSQLDRDTSPVLGDPVQIHQVLMNLCVNSRDAMPQGGVLTLSVQQVVIDAASAQLHGVTAGNFSVLCVQDTGMGISADDLDRIYDPFFTTKPLGEGTGLGLSTVLGIVKSHLGFIQVESQLGKGTTFRILFPSLESAPSPSVGVSSDVLPTGRGELILVVDDEELTRQMVQQVLAQHGYRVLLARNGTEALSQLDARPDLRLVLSDAMMSGMDGPTLLHHAKQRGVTAEFLIMTGLQSQPALQEVMSRYGVSLLEKPFSAATLLQSVQCVLQHRPYLSPSEA